MPNWCFNSVIVSAKTEAELQEFLDFCNQPHTSNHVDWKTNEHVLDENAKGVFWNFITPTDLESYFGNKTFQEQPDGVSVMEHITKQFAEGMDWYHWNTRNWGTKWDITLDPDSIPVFEQNKNGEWYFNWNFETAWSPAEPAYYAMAERFPNLTFDYEITEEANFYAGKLFFENGVLVSEHWVDSPTHHDFEELDIPCPECGWAESGNCLDNPDTDVLDLETTTTTTLQG